MDNLANYSGLIHATTRRYHGPLGEEYEELEGGLRLKVCEALSSYDGTKSSMDEKSYVFMCVKSYINSRYRKLKVREGVYSERYIEDMRGVSTDNGSFDGDWFDAEYMCEDAHEPQEPLLPSGISALGKRVAFLLHIGYNQHEVARRLGLNRREVLEAVEGIRAAIRAEMNGSFPL